MNKMSNNKMTKDDLDYLAASIVNKMVKLKTMETWFDHVSKTDTAWNSAYEDIEMTEEEDAISEAAKLMTLLNLFQDKEEYEKCAIVKNRLDEINKILKKY
tara:strand:+ start:141 stop:443 length:303 start_codon:yes stop_codon:yes gene_type:complete